jgi:hypothetical protein
MKMSFGLGIGVGLGVFAAIPAAAPAQCFSAPRRVYVQPYQPVYTPNPYSQAPQYQPVQQYPQPIPQPQQSLPVQQTSYSSPVNAGVGKEFKHAMHGLWDDHVSFTRLYLVSTLADLPDKDATAQRLLKNQADIGNAFKPYYGDASGDKLAGLLKEHITIATEVIAAAKANDAAKKEEQTKKWQANADAIAAFLTGANPQNWPEQQTKAMMRQHLDLTAAEVDARVKKDWAADLDAFDKVRDQIRHMADTIATGVVNQFPDRFRR